VHADAGYTEPQIDGDNQPFWQAIDEGRLLVWLCAGCNETFLPPLPGCPHCGSSDVAPALASGRGRLESWIVVHRALSPEFTHDVPYAVGAVRLNEGARIFGRLVGRPSELDLREGLELKFAPLPRGSHLMIAFEPAGA
jgi:uncharacterized OB-fold protein